MNDGPLVKAVTFATAIPGLGMWWLMPFLNDVSSAAGLLVPIASLVWLVTQIVKAWRGK